MAEEIGFQVNVKGGDSLASLKKEFKSLQAELEKTEAGTVEYQKTLERLGAVKDDMGDLRDAIGALNPEGKVAAFQNVAGKLAGGFQAATGAAALFGAKSEELEKQLLKVQAATALAQGIQSIVGLTDAFVVLKTAVMATNPALLIIAGSIAAISAAYVLWKEVIGETAQADKLLNAELERQKANQEAVNDEIGRQLEVSKLLAKQESDRVKLEIEAQIKLIAATRTREMLLRQITDRTEEQNKEITDLAKKDADLTNQLTILKIKLNKTLADEEKKRIDEINEKEKERIAREKERLNKISEERKKNAVEYDLIYSDAIELIGQKQEEAAKEEEERLKNVAKLEQENQAIRVANFQEEERLRKEKEAAEKVQAEAKLQAENNFFNAAQGLSTAFFQTQLMMAEGNAEETDKIRKRQFQTEKAFNVARAIIDGYRAVNAALVIPPPAGPILAASNAILAAASVAKILSTQYSGGNSAGSGNVSLPRSTGSASVPSPTIQAPVNPQDTTQFNAQGYNISKVVVVEKDITSVQNRMNRLKVQATY